MAEGVDYSFASPSAAGLAAAGKKFAGRYVGPGSGKFLTIPERDALFANGLDIFLLAEGSVDSALGGWSVGVDHARQARDHARSLGAPDSTAIYFAVDYDVSSKGWTAPRDYLAGAGSVLGPGRVGVYGEYDVMGWAQRDGVAAWFFQTYAWSSGQWFAGNHVEQYHNGVIVAGGEVDLCRSKQPNFGQWRADGADPGQIFPDFPGHEAEDEDMKLYLVSAPNDPAVWLSNGIYRRGLASQAEIEGWLLQGAIRYENVELAWYGPDINALHADGSSGGVAPSHEELAQAAFEGAQRAERE